MQEYNEKRGLQIGCRQGCQQNPNADNQFEARLRRIIETTGAKNETQLAKILEIKQQSIAGARKRKQLPTGWITRISEKLGISANWLLFGEGPRRRDEISPAYERSSKEPTIKDKENPFLGAESLVEGIKTIFNQFGLDMVKTESLLMFHLLVDLFVRELKKRDTR